MENTKIELDETGRGQIYYEEEGGQIGFMRVSITNGTLTVYHTEVQEKAQGKGIARQLFDYLIAYLRENKLKLRPLCPYVHAQVKRRPEEYADVYPA